MRRILALLLATSALTTPLFAEDAAPQASTEVALPAITVSKVELRQLSDHVLAAGLIAPTEEVAVAPLVEGQPIEALLVDVGQTVEAGQVLARLSRATLELQQSQLQASLASAQTQSNEARKTAIRSAALFKQGATSAAANDQAQSAAIAAQAALDGLTAQLANTKLLLSRTEIKAPVAGLVLSRNAQVGAVASAAGQPLFTIIKDSALELRADVAEADLPRLKEGLEAEIRLAADVAPLKGKIRLVEPGVDATTRMGRARIAIDPGQGVHPGMYGEATILVVSRQTPAIPVTAIGSEDGKTTVMAVKDGTIHRTEVTTGIREGGWIEITEGLVPGHEIVTRAGSFVADGDKINPIPQTATN
jgi:HlyD family secretion protein